MLHVAARSHCTFLSLCPTSLRAQGSCPGMGRARGSTVETGGPGRLGGQERVRMRVGMGGVGAREVGAVGVEIGGWRC